MATSLASGNNI